MRKVIEVTGTAIIAEGVFAIPTFIMQPPPIPSLTGLVGGLIGFWLARKRRYAMVSVGALAGVLVGVGLHSYQHYAENRLHPEGGLLAHLGLNAGGGLAVAGVVLAVVFAMYRVIVGPLIRLLQEAGVAHSEQMGKRPRLTDGQRRRLAVLGKTREVILRCDFDLNVGHPRRGIAR